MVLPASYCPHQAGESFNQSRSTLGKLRPHTAEGQSTIQVNLLVVLLLQAADGVGAPEIVAAPSCGGAAARAGHPTPTLLSPDYSTDLRLTKHTGECCSVQISAAGLGCEWCPVWLDIILEHAVIASCGPI